MHPWLLKDGLRILQDCPEFNLVKNHTDIGVEQRRYDAGALQAQHKPTPGKRCCSRQQFGHVEVWVCPGRCAGGATAAAATAGAVAGAGKWASTVVTGVKYDKAVATG